MVALNGTPLNGTPLNGTPTNSRWLAPSTPPTLPTQGHDFDEVTYIDLVGINKPRQDASSASEHAPRSSTDLIPWPAPDPFELERAQLVSELAIAKDRAAGVRARVARRESEMKAALRAEFVAVRGVLDQMERQHDARIAAVRAAAKADVEQILGEARGAEFRRSSTAEPQRASDAD